MIPILQSVTLHFLMSNLKHGFYSKDENINPDARMLSLNISSLTSDDLVLCERFLIGNENGIVDYDIIRAHEIAKIIYQFGRFKYHTLWIKADDYVNGYEYDSMEMIANLPKVKI